MILNYLGGSAGETATACSDERRQEQGHESTHGLQGALHQRRRWLGTTISIWAELKYDNVENKWQHNVNNVYI